MTTSGSGLWATGMEASAGDRPPILKKEVHVVPFVFFVIER